MATQKDISLKKAKQFLKYLNQAGVEVDEAYLFGSSLEGVADKESDIDLAVVSRDFQGIPFYDVKKISKYRRKVDLRLEIHPFSLNEVETNPSLFFMKIKKDGFRIQ